MGRDPHERRKQHGKEDPNPAAKYRSIKTSAVDWENRRSRSARIGAYYRKKFGEALYARRYLDDDKEPASATVAGSHD